jgi:hypothetical protein
MTRTKPLPLLTEAQKRALDAVEYAVISAAQTATEERGMLWVCEGTQMRYCGRAREIVVRLRPREDV